ncbi:hypothetical protein [Breoghania sp.]|uniref:MarR family winged helix-turn-helix transcriptional regulator n=1 Tax=Breoghania sp. TaxID=2065378 RepID=UPI00262107DF|nr:hypothetical protein [Breoghania sp.]MDJ0930890.1 hypothetical protein [Breoghania sp.]
MIDRLVAKGLLTRKVSEKDRRARTLHVTEAGLETLQASAPTVEVAQRRMLQGLDEDERAEFLRLMKKALQAVNDFSRAPLKEE